MEADMAETERSGLVDHEARLVALGTIMARAVPGQVDWAVLGQAIAEAVNGLPAVRAAISGGGPVQSGVVHAAYSPPPDPSGLDEHEAAQTAQTPSDYHDMMAGILRCIHGAPKWSCADPSGPDALWYVCPDCDGGGWNPSHDPEKPMQVQCERCVGSGRLRAAIQESRAGGCPDPEHPGGAYCTDTTGLATCYPPESRAGGGLDEAKLTRVLDAYWTTHYGELDPGMKQRNREAAETLAAAYAKEAGS